jgi:predicted transcriptional regulator
MSGARIQKRVAALGRRSRGERIPADLRKEIAEYACGRRAEGGAVREIAAETGVSPESIRRWAVRAERAGATVVPVRVRDAEVSAKIVVVMPSGVRVEGLDVEQAAELARRLG